MSKTVTKVLKGNLMEYMTWIKEKWKIVGISLEKSKNTEYFLKHRRVFLKVRFLKVGMLDLNRFLILISGPSGTPKVVGLPHIPKSLIFLNKFYSYNSPAYN